MADFHKIIQPTFDKWKNAILLYFTRVLGNGPYPNTNHLDALPTCSQAQRACNKDRNCFRIYKNYQNACKVDRDGKCRMENW